MKIAIRHACVDSDSYRAARVKSLFNVDAGNTFVLDAELPIEGWDWKIGLVVGPSGSGKSSLGARIWGPRVLWRGGCWPKNAPIIDAIAPGGRFDAVTSALAAVGLGSVPSWLRPYRVLSTGERFRAELARIIAEAPRHIVVDEFTSVVDRQIARVGALAFQKAWRRAPGQCVLLSCHYDIVRWLEPDWVFDTGTGRFSRRWRRRPPIIVDLWETDWRYWPLFEPHHYLKLPKMIAATNYVATVAGEPVAHVAVSTRPGLIEGRACRLVVMPEWQGAGIGVRFLDAVCERWRHGLNRFGKPMPMLFHTSHPGLAAALRRSPNWAQVSASLHGGRKARSAATIAHWAMRAGKRGPQAGYGGHFRAVQGFRYWGSPEGAAGQSSASPAISKRHTLGRRSMVIEAHAGAMARNSATIAASSASVPSTRQNTSSGAPGSGSQSKGTAPGRGPTSEE